MDKIVQSVDGVLHFTILSQSVFYKNIWPQYSSRIMKKDSVRNIKTPHVAIKHHMAFLLLVDVYDL